MDNYKFSTIMYVDSDGLFENALENLKANGLMDQGVQLIVVDPYEDDEIKSVCGNLGNAVYIPMEDAHIAQAYNKGLEAAEGRIINFTISSAGYEDHVYHKAGRVLDKYDVPFITCRPVQKREFGDYPYQGSNMPRDKEDYVDLYMNSYRFQLAIQGYFFRKEILEGRTFDESLFEEALYEMVLNILMDHPVHYQVRYLFYYYTVGLEDDTSANPLQYQKWWYKDSVDNFIIPLLEKAKKRTHAEYEIAQWACFYLMYAKINCNIFDRNKGVLETREEVQDFYNSVCKALTYIDNAIISKGSVTSYFTTRRVFRLELLRGKTEYLGKTLDITNSTERFITVAKSEDNKVGKEGIDIFNDFAYLGKISDEFLRLRIINYENDSMIIEAVCPAADIIDPDDIKIYCVTQTPENGKRDVYEAERIGVYPLVKAFGFTIRRRLHVRFRIPVGKREKHLTFFYEFNEARHSMRIAFETANSRLVRGEKNAYWMFRPFWILECDGARRLVIRKMGRREQLTREVSLARELYGKEENKALAREGINLRRKYWQMKKSFEKKSVWVTFDKLYKAGDNGEYMYQYVKANKSNETEIYYIIRPDSPDYERLVKQDKKHVLVYGTLECELICLLADVLLATHANIMIQFDEGRRLSRYNKDLFRGDVVCIQHGLTIQKIAQYQNSQFDNTRLYCCASPYEVKNISEPMYNYSPDQIKLTGLARYDGLKNRDQKIILITPSWRRNVVNSSVANIKKSHNDNFKNSEYYRIYNQLINDERLIESAKKNGYRVIYLLHPAMSAQIDDYDRNDFVELIPATGDVSYEKILCESSLMVTDYSGVQFDFAYMRKPVVYYHPDALPPHYEEGGLIYETMGFGPICKDNEQLVDTLCEYMEDQCRTKEEYVKRADDFFAFDDHNNCERIYNTIKEWEMQRKAMR